MKPLHQQIEQIEQSTSNELEYFTSVGPKYFTTAELLELCGSVKTRLKLFNKLHKVVILIGASSPAWLVVGFLSSLMGLQGLAAYFTALFPISFTLCLVGAFWMKKEFNSKGYLEYVARELRNELLARRKQQEKWN